MAKTPQKGEVMEEILRNYFLRARYYVARGVPYNYRGFGVTDIDLWFVRKKLLRVAGNSNCRHKE